MSPPWGCRTRDGPLLRTRNELCKYLDPEKAHLIFDNPAILYKKAEEPVLKHPAEPEPVIKKDPIDAFIEKLYA